MSLLETPDSNEIPIELERQIDRICDAFELSYQRNERPRIEDYLDETLGEVGTQLTELVLVELTYRQKAGDAPTVQEYVSRFPSYSDVLKGISAEFQIESPGGYRTPPRVEKLESFKFIGSGTFGAVWKAWDTNLHRFVAVKTPIRPVLTQSDRALILREAQIVAQTKHPFIVPVHSSGENDGRVYIVYEFVPGKTLKDRLGTATFTQKQAASLCAKIADALDHVHKLNIVHRDLKPANILIDPNNDPHVMDFGLAKLIDTKSTIGVTGFPLGTLAYMSPEQAAGKSEETDGRSDIYALGAILYELVTEKLPFHGSRDELMHQILNVPAPLLSKLRPDVDYGLEQICSKCLEKTRDDRFATAADLAASLRRYINDEDVGVRPVGSYVHGWRWLRRRRVPAVMALLALAPLFGFLAMSRMPQLPDTAPPDIAPPEPRIAVIQTKPPGATVMVRRCDSKTGEADLLNWAALVGKTPDRSRLLPGRYFLTVTLEVPGGVLTHEVHRTVPDPTGRWASMAVYWEQSTISPKGDVEWPVIVMPPLKPLFEMTLVPGDQKFIIDGPDGPRAVSVAPFYVATREFTFSDFQIIRPGKTIRVGDRPATLDPPGNTMPSRYDFAEHWAEAAGCRLLTDLEFAYLASLAQAAQSQKGKLPPSPETYDEAGASEFDEIPLEPPIRGILTGYPEWTSTWPTSPRATVKFEIEADVQKHPERYRVIRGGSLSSGPADHPRAPQSSAVAFIYEDIPKIGFRLARTASGNILPK
jgi:hypothetical protein